MEKHLGAGIGLRLLRRAGDLAGKHSIRINNQWRIVFRWTDAGPEDVRDAHRAYRDIVTSAATRAASGQDANDVRIFIPNAGELVPRGGIEPPTLRFSVTCTPFG